MPINDNTWILSSLMKYGIYGLVLYFSSERGEMEEKNGIVNLVATRQL